MKVQRQISFWLLIIGFYLQNQNLKSQTNQIFPENSIGIVYLDTLKSNKYFLIVRFPNSALLELNKRNESNYIKDIPIEIPAQDIILFDEAGELASIRNVTNCISRLWCENDAGIQYNPTFILEVEMNQIKRTLQSKNPNILGKIACFAVINYNALHFKTFYPSNQRETENTIMRGRLSADYKGYAYRPPKIYQYYDRNVQIIAEPDDSGITNYCIFLEAFNSRLEFEIGCCGP